MSRADLFLARQARHVWHNPHHMKYLVIFAFAAFGLSQLPAQEKFDYAAAVKLVAERTEIPKPSNSVIYILGPQQNEEVVISNGKETKRTVPFCRAELVAPSGTPLNRLLSTGSVDSIFNASEGRVYKILVYRADIPDPVVLIVGAKHVVQSSQFPLKAGDVLVVSASDEKKKK